MPYSIPDKASLESLIDYTAAAGAAVQAMPETEGLAGPLGELQATLHKARDERDQARYAVLRASARVAVWDARWDEALIQLSGRAYLAAGKQASAEPYASLFGEVRANDAIRLGPHKATVLGSRLLARAREQGHVELKPLLPAFEKINDALAKAHEQRLTMLEQAAVHEVRRYKLVDALEVAIAQVEIGVLTAMPGQGKVARAMFSWAEHMARPRRAVAEAATDDGLVHPPAGGDVDGIVDG